MNAASFSLLFGPFSLAFPQRALSRDGNIIRLGSRATDILVALVEANGELVSRDALIAKVWPDTVVDEGALRVHLSGLRKALGEGAEGVQYIGNEPGRGYKLLTAVIRAHSLEKHSANPPLAPGHNLPGQTAHVLGRGDVIDRLLAQLLDRRCLTIAGPGGIGKTTVAIALAHQFISKQHGRVCFVDFAPLLEPSAVVGALATALDVSLSSEDTLRQVVSTLGAGPLLLVFDNCEHLIEPIACLVEKLLQDASEIRLLITSREPLRVEGEWIHRLAALATPSLGAVTDVAQALEFSAVQLFVEQAMAARDDFVLDENNLAAVCDICRRLDGLPLAIEFAAARVGWLDVHTIAAHLDARFKLFTKGRRNALPRHQTLKATLDWSYDLLSLRSRAVLRRIALFRTGFDRPALINVATCSQIDELEIMDAASDLIAKSLLTCDFTSGEATYRLLDTTRYYGLDHLDACGEGEEFRLRHAQYCLELFTSVRGGDSKLDCREMYSRRVDDIRAALDWALSPGGNTGIGLSLVVAASSLWLNTAVVSEFITVAESALAAVLNTELEGTSLHVQLLNIYGQAHLSSGGPLPSMADAFTRSFGFASQLGDPVQAMCAIRGLWLHRLSNGMNAASLLLAEDFHTRAVEVNAPEAVAIGLGMISASLHYMGDADGANRQTASAQDHDALPMPAYCVGQGHPMLFKWLQGNFSEALDVARATAEEVQVLDHDLLLCETLATGVIPVAFWSGDLATAATLTSILRERAQRRGMSYWDRWGEGFESALKGQPMDLRAATLVQVETFATIGLVCALDRLEAQGRHFDEGWAQPELLRRRAERSRDPWGDQSVADLELSFEIAKRQTARAWQLRTALSLATARQFRGEGAASRLWLAEILEPFSKVQDHGDVRAAARFLNVASTG